MSRALKPGRVALARRLEAVMEGTLADPALADLRLERMAHFPLEQWFSLQPQRMETLVQTYGIPGNATFCQAAALLYYRMKQKGDPQAAEGMWLLLSPLLDFHYYLTKQQKGDVYCWGLQGKKRL